MNKTKTISYDQRALFFWVLVAVTLVSFTVYIYAVHTTARNVAARQDLEKQIVKISTNLDSLEFAFIELKNNVTVELAYQYGFREVKNPLFVSRSRAASLSYNTLSR